MSGVTASSVPVVAQAPADTEPAEEVPRQPSVAPTLMERPWSPDALSPGSSIAQRSHSVASTIMPVPDRPWSPDAVSPRNSLEQRSHSIVSILTIPESRPWNSDGFSPRDSVFRRTLSVDSAFYSPGLLSPEAIPPRTSVEYRSRSIAGALLDGAELPQAQSRRPTVADRSDSIFVGEPSTTGKASMLPEPERSASFGRRRSYVRSMTPNSPNSPQLGRPSSPKTPKTPKSPQTGEVEPFPRRSLGARPKTPNTPKSPQFEGPEPSPRRGSATPRSFSVSVLAPVAETIPDNRAPDMAVASGSNSLLSPAMALNRRRGSQYDTAEAGPSTPTRRRSHKSSDRPYNTDLDGV